MYTTLVLGAAFLVAPFYIRFESVPMDMRYYKDWFFQFITIMMVIAPGSKKIPKNIFYVLVGVLLIAFFNQWLCPSKMVRYQFVSFSFGIVFLIQMIRLYPGKDKLLNLISISCLIGSIWVILDNLLVGPYDLLAEVYGLHKVFTGTPDLPPGFLGNQMLTGNFIALTLPSMMRRKWVYWAFLPGLAIGFLRGATAIVPAIIVLISFLLFKNRIKILKVLSAIIFALTFFLPFYVKQLTGFLHASERSDVWANCLTVNDGINIFIGKGLGWFPDFYMRSFKHVENFVQAHNEFVEAYVAFGLIGVGAFVYLIFLMWRSDSMIIHLAIPSICIVIAGGFPFHVAPLTIIVISYFIIGINKHSHGGNNEFSSNKSGI